jgi:hypothetical protein
MLLTLFFFDRFDFSCIQPKYSMTGFCPAQADYLLFAGIQQKNSKLQNRTSQAA